MVQHRPLFCDMVFQNNSLSFEPRKLATHISQCLGRSSLVPLVSQSRCGISNSLLDRLGGAWMVLATTSARYLQRRSSRHNQNSDCVYSTER